MFDARVELQNPLHGDISASCVPQARGGLYSVGILYRLCGTDAMLSPTQPLNILHKNTSRRHSLHWLSHCATGERQYTSPLRSESAFESGRGGKLRPCVLSLRYQMESLSDNVNW